MICAANQPPAGGPSISPASPVRHRPARTRPTTQTNPARRAKQTKPPIRFVSSRLRRAPSEYPRRRKAGAAEKEVESVSSHLASPRLAMGIGYVVGVLGGTILAHAAYATVQCTSHRRTRAGYLWISPFPAPLGSNRRPRSCVFARVCSGRVEC